MTAEHVFYGGKGGVGKTTCATATAVRSAAAGDTTLVVSTDPAHSLSDSLEREIDTEPTRVTDRLWGVEVDTEAMLGQYRTGAQALPQKVSDIGGPVGSVLGLDQLGDELGGEIGELFDGMLSAPGSDEVAALQCFEEYMGSDRWDRVVFDTAPTGHSLRLLQLPEVVDTTVGRVVGIGKQAGGVVDSVKTVFQEEETNDIDELQRNVADIRDQLTDPEQTEFRVVTIPEQMAVLETERLVAQLKEFEIPVGTVVLNKVLSESNEECHFCQQRRESQLENLELAQSVFQDLTVQPVPLKTGDVHGIEALSDIGETLAE
jgi:arsenite-transporting ATPase